jgi:DNA topoisomerase-6 subunit B
MCFPPKPRAFARVDWGFQRASAHLTTRSYIKPPQDFISKYVLDIDIHKNQPNIHSEEKLPNPDKWHGAELSVTIEGAWSTYRARILKYLRQLAVITPYAAFHFQCALSLSPSAELRAE